MHVTFPAPRRAAWIVLTALFAAMQPGCGSSDRPSSVAQRSGAIEVGHARLTVITPTLIRLEYAEDGQFEDGPTQTVPSRAYAATPFTARNADGVLTVETSALKLQYDSRAGAFDENNVAVELLIDGEPATIHPGWTYNNDPQNLGGWLRGLDNQQDPQPMNPGLLSRAGWYLLDDSATAQITTTPPGFSARPAHAGTYQDGYLFAYGHDYARGLSDLRTLTGPAPLLPRKALGVWFSRYWAYSDAELRDLVGQFRAHQVPLDTLSLDTDWKLMHDAQGCVIFDAVAGARTGDACSWNGWDWEPSLFPDPSGFLAWAHGQGLSIVTNVHPSIDSTDPRFDQTQTTSGGLNTDRSLPPCTLFQADPLGQCYVFDWTQASQLEAYFALHAPMEAQGIDFWWLDWCCDGSSADAPGLAADTWINARYAARNRERGTRWPSFSRIGGSFQEGDAGIGNNGAGAFAEHRYTMHFTGDTCGTWQMLAHEAEFTVREGNIGLPYVSHDIGSFLGPPVDTTGCNGTLGHTSHLPDDMYVRWVQLGTFQPLDRLHSHHGDRLPWDYPGAAEAAATAFLQLRERLVPYLYSLARQAYDTGLPMTRALYLQWPQLEEAYAHPTEFMLGPDMLVATVTTAGNPASVDLWLPPGTWTDYFTGETLIGPQTLSVSVPFDRYPVYMRAGALLPTQPDVDTSAAGPQDNLTVTAWAGAEGHFDLYDDAGKGLAYETGAYQSIPLSTVTSPQGCVSMTVGPARGDFDGALPTRSWTLSIVGIDMPASVTLDGQTGMSWSYASERRMLTVTAEHKPVDRAVSLRAGPASCVFTAQ